MRSNPTKFSFAGCLAVLGFGLIVSSKATANVLGVDTQNFNPITDGLDFVTVHSSKTLDPGVVNFGFFLNYAVNSLPNYENISNQSRTDIVDTLFSSDFNFGVGLTRIWDAGFSLPQVHQQTVDSEIFRGQFETAGITELRFNTKVRVLGDSESGGMAMAASMNLNRIEDNPFAGQNPNPTFNYELVLDKSDGEASYSLNLGYRLRSPGDPIPGVPVLPFGNQYIASGAISYLISSWDTKLIAEIFSSFPAQSDEFTSDRDLSSMELLVGMKMDLSHTLAFHAGGGTEISHGTGSPDWRIYSGLNWNIEPFSSGSKREGSIVRSENDKVVELSADDEDPFEGDPSASRETFIGRGVLFAFNSDEATEDLIKILTPMVEYLKRPPGFKQLIIEGHTDSVGGAPYNLELSQRRAARVKKSLVNLGLPSKKIKSSGFGEEKPIAPNTNYQGRSRNRRVEFKVYR